LTLLVEKGTFVKETSNVDGTDQTITLTNSSLTPKVLWLWTSAQTANATYNDVYIMSYGFSDGTNDACIAAACADADSDGATGGIIRNDSVCCIFLEPATIALPVISAQANVVSFGAGQFVLDWAISDATASIIHYMVVGGTDITNVIVVSRTVTDGTGASSYTDVGFQGNFVNFLSMATGIAVNTTTNAWNMSIGAATSSSARWSFGGDSEALQAAADTYNYKEMTSCLTQWNPSTGVVVGLADFTGFTSTGFDLNYTDAWGNVNDRIAYLVIKGGTWDVGNGTAPASTGTQNVTLSSGADPTGLMIFTWGDTTTSSAGTGEAENRIAIGGGDNSLTMGCISNHDLDAATNMVSSRISLVTKVIRAHTAVATATSSTIVAEAGLTDMSTAGQFSLNWTTTLSGMGYTWFTVSAAISVNNVTRALPTETITLSDTRTVARNKTRTRSETVTATD
jgi:hypothetical protein